VVEWALVKFVEMERSGNRLAGDALISTGQMPHEVLQNFFKSLLNTKDRSSVSPGSASAEPWVTVGKAGTLTWYFDGARDIWQWWRHAGRCGQWDGGQIIR
jgi:hypothetical protein